MTPMMMMATMMMVMVMRIMMMRMIMMIMILMTSVIAKMTVTLLMIVDISGHAMNYNGCRLLFLACRCDASHTITNAS